MASILDVARVAKVSPSTVSLVVNHGHRVSPSTRRRVEAVIRRLKYRGRDGQAFSKTRPGRALRLGFIYTPGAMIKGADTLYNRQIIQGIEQSLVGSASSVNIMRGYGHVDEDHMLNQSLDAREFDGLLVVGLRPGDGYIERIADAGVPLLVFNRSTDPGVYSVVSADYFGGGVQAINHLVTLGHQRIGLLLKSQVMNWPAQLVLNGCRQALRRHQLQPIADELIPADDDLDQLRQVCQRMLEQGITAIQTGDVTAAHLLSVLPSLGVKAPDDISIMGFDDRGLVCPSGQALTTIGYDRVRMGRIAGNMIQRLSRPNCRTQWLGAAVKTAVVQGQTVAAPPSAQG